MFSFRDNYKSWLRAPLHTGPATQMFSKNTNDEEPGTNSSMQCLPSHNLIFLIDRKIQTSSLSVIVSSYLPQFQEQGPSHPGGWCYKEEHFCCISPKVSSLSWVFGPPGLWLFGDWKISAFWHTQVTSVVTEVQHIALFISSWVLVWLGPVFLPFQPKHNSDFVALKDPIESQYLEALVYSKGVFLTLALNLMAH